MNWLRHSFGSLGAHVGGRDNNFNLIRFLAATAVLFSHSYALSIGNPNAEPLRASLGVTLGQIAVDVFFMTSGFLVTASLIARKEVLTFAIARCLRIYPGLIVAIVLTTLVVGWNFTTLAPREFFSSTDTWRYVIKNSTMITGEAHMLPGAFETTPWRHLVNASLWTLPYELGMYCTLGVLWIVLSALRSNRQLRWGVLCIAVTGLSAQLALHDSLSSNALRLTALFFVGSSLYTFRDAIPMSGAIFLALSAALLVSALDARWFNAVYLLSMPYLVLFLAYIPGGAVRRFNDFGDCSYGMYIYAWPVQQISAALLPKIEPLPMFAVSFVVTLALAFVSWRLVEKPALSLKGRAPRPSPSLTGAG